MPSLPPFPAPAASRPSAGPQGPAHVAQCRTAASLSVIGRSNLTLAVWRRRLPAGIAAQSAAIAADGLSCHLATSPADAATDLRSALPPRRIEGPLLADIVDLVWIYAEIVGCRAVRLRLDSLSGDGCRYFHVDYV
ncbi:DUF1826 domain-containing protein, partial [Azospirillum sp. B506]|uniref:DUF1826 domain-containing protein n=1 Tax=Azospirillum sp. B506 TaxID=137721 RepID=UPI0005B2E331